MADRIEDRVGAVKRTMRVLASSPAPVSKPLLEEAMTEAADTLDELLCLVQRVGQVTAWHDTKEAQHMTETVSVKVAHTIPRDRIECLLTSAFEGGSNYWIRWVKTVREGEDIYEAAFGYGVRVQGDDEQHSRLLNMAAMAKGMQDMADLFPRHMADVLNGNDDATTGDVFLQLCLFGDVVYG